VLRFPKGKKSEEILAIQTRGACGNRSVISRIGGIAREKGVDVVKHEVSKRSNSELRVTARGHMGACLGKETSAHLLSNFAESGIGKSVVWCCENI
jgi:hypothetical protein